MDIMHQKEAYSSPDIDVLAKQPEFVPLIEKAHALLNTAREVALEHLSLDTEGRERVENALTHAFYPYALEAEVIGAGLVSNRYESFQREIKDFFGGARVGFVACPDGRIAAISLGDPRVTSVYRKLRGMLRTRESSRKADERLPINIVLNSSIEAAMKDAHDKGKAAKLVECIGPHINSVDPTHGCGAAAARLSGATSGLPVTQQSMWDGGITQYFDEAAETGAYDALPNVARNAGGSGISFDLTHDIATQGLIFGLRTHYKELSSKQTLAQNLIRLTNDRKIIMTALLATEMKNDIMSQANALDPTFDIHHPKDARNFVSFIDTSILIGRTALNLTEASKKNGYPFIPKDLCHDATDQEIQILAYHLIRNAVYQVICGIKPGHHTLVHHPERVQRVGPIGADFNVATIPFILGTPDQMSGTDIDDALAIYQLMGRFLPEQGVSLTKEARLIMTTGAFDPDIYKSTDAARLPLTLAKHTVLNNTSLLRRQLQEAAQTGYAVILPVIHHSRNRSLSVVT